MEIRPCGRDWIQGCDYFQQPTAELLRKNVSDLAQKLVSKPVQYHLPEIGVAFQNLRGHRPLREQSAPDDCH